MRGRLMAAAAAVAVLSVSGCDREDAGTASAPAAPEPAPTADAPLAAADTAAGFVSRVALGDMYEVASGRIALQQSQNNDVKRFAQMMVDDHTRTSNEIRAAIAQQGVQVALPEQMDEPRRNLINDLNSAAPEDFDDRYIDQQIQAHETTLGLLRDYARSGDNPAFRDWASRTAPAVENHLQMARGLKRTPTGDPGGAANNEGGAQRR